MQNDRGLFREAWELGMESLLNPEFLFKFLVVLATAPFWAPVLKTIWRELDLALSPEGGILGRRERSSIARRPAAEDPWVSVPKARYRGRRTPAPGASSRPRRAADSPAGAPVRGVRRRGL